MVGVRLNDEQRALVAGNVGLVYQAVNEINAILQGEQPIEDLEQDGFEGFCEAVCYFDPQRGIRLSTYCHRPIRQAIWNGVRFRRPKGVRNEPWAEKHFNKSIDEEISTQNNGHKRLTLQDFLPESNSAWADPARRAVAKDELRRVLAGRVDVEPGTFSNASPERERKVLRLLAAEWRMTEMQQFGINEKAAGYYRRTTKKRFGKI